MNKGKIYIVYLVFSLTLIGCQEDEPKVVEIASLEESISFTNKNLRKASIDIEKSTIRWRGTKMMGSGSHEGLVNVKEGVLLFDNDVLVGGQIVSALDSISVTDIPAHKTIPINNIINHLRSDFETDKYPSSKFDIIKVNYVGKSNLEVSGKLTIKNVSKDILITASISKGSDGQSRFVTSFSIDRFDYNIGIDGGWLEKKLVDDEFSLIIELVII